MRGSLPLILQMDNSACLHLRFSSGPQWQLAGNRTWSKLPVLQGSNQPDRESYTPQQLRGPTRFTMRRSSCTKWTSDVSVIVGLDRVNQHHTQTQLCTIILPSANTNSDNASRFPNRQAIGSHYMYLNCELMDRAKGYLVHDKVSQCGRHFHPIL